MLDVFFDNFSQNLLVGTPIPHSVRVNDHNWPTFTSAQTADFRPLNVDSILTEEFACLFYQAFAFTIAAGTEEKMS
jgi:hypothetical protein